jgi:hypothetical protein
MRWRPAGSPAQRATEREEDGGREQDGGPQAPPNGRTGSPVTFVRSTSRTSKQTPAFHAKTLRSGRVASQDARVGRVSSPRRAAEPASAGIARRIGPTRQVRVPGISSYVRTRSAAPVVTAELDGRGRGPRLSSGVERDGRPGRARAARRRAEHAGPGLRRARARREHSKALLYRCAGSPTLRLSSWGRAKDTWSQQDRRSERCKWAREELNLRPLPCQQNTGNRCANRGSPRSPPTVKAEGKRSLGVQGNALFAASADAQWSLDHVI